MANTLNLGTNGNWATKKGSTLAYNDENGNFKPLPFNFERSTTATRVNKQGLIEVVSNNEPRIDFKDSSEGSLLLEPARTNLVTYSEDFSNASWFVNNGTLTINQKISPKGDLTADKIVFGSGGGTPFIDNDIDTGSTIASKDFTFSLYVYSEVEFDTWLRIRGLGTTTEAENITVNIKKGWNRVSATKSFTSSADGNSLKVALFDLNLDFKTLFIWGAQLEQGSYATSYIPTSGSAVTRIADVCNNGANEQVINSTEGVLYAEISPLANDLTNRHIGISDDTNTNRLQIFFNTYGTTQIRTLNLVNNVKYFDMQSNVTLINGYVKVAIKYKENDFALWVNGIKAATDNSGLVWSNGTLDTLKFADGNNASPFYGNVKDVKLYNTALTDQELATLTTI